MAGVAGEDAELLVPAVLGLRRARHKKNRQFEDDRFHWAAPEMRRLPPVIWSGCGMFNMLSSVGLRSRRLPRTA